MPINFALRHDGQGIGSFQTPHGLEQAVFAGVARRLGKQVEDNFAIDSGGENCASLLQSSRSAVAFGEIAVVGHGDLAAFAFADERAARWRKCDEPVVE